MTFLIDAQELKTGLIIFRRGDVRHRNWYCRIKLPKEDRYKTVSLKTTDINEARDKAFDRTPTSASGSSTRSRSSTKPSARWPKEYSAFQKQRSEAGQITHHRWRVIESHIKTQLNPYVGTIQITQIGEDRWKTYPDLAPERPARAAPAGASATAPSATKWTTFRAIMRFAAGKRYIRESQVFPRRLGPRQGAAGRIHARRNTASCTASRAAGSRRRATSSALVQDHGLQLHAHHDQYRHAPVGGEEPPLARHRHAEGQARPAIRPPQRARQGQIPHAGRRRVPSPPISTASARISKATKPDDPVFTTDKGKPARTLYYSLVERLLIEVRTAE